MREAEEEQRRSQARTATEKDKVILDLLATIYS